MNRPRLICLALLFPLVACLEAEMTIQPDGSVKGSLSWTVQPGATADTARLAVKAEGVTISHLEVKEAPAPGAKAGTSGPLVRRATAQLEAKSLSALAQMPLLKVAGATLTLGEPSDGKRTLTVRAANTSKLTAPSPATDNLFRLHFPGPVEKTSAKADGKDVTWTVKASDYFDEPSVELSVVYAVGGTAPAAN